MLNWNKNVLLDGKLSNAAIFAFSFVDTTIGATANEADDFVALVDPLFGVVPGEHGLRGICRVLWNVSYNLAMKTFW